MAVPLLSVERVRARPGGVRVVVVDLRPLAGSRSLAAALAAGDDRLDLRRIDVVRDLAAAGTYLSLPDLAYSYAPMLGHVDGIVGHLGASVLAGAMATAFAEPDGVRPPVLFVDPARPTVRQAVDDCGAFLARFGAPPPPPGSAWGCGGQPAHLLMTSALRAAIAGPAADGPEAEEAVALLARFGGWLGFLLAAADAPGLNGRGVPGADRTVVTACPERPALPGDAAMPLPGDPAAATPGGGAGTVPLDDTTVRQAVAAIYDLVSDRKGDRP
ncbi:hypothetical protein [Pseudosporangium ferrugineum]|uniref:Alpha/beta hydrolase family protein n=1 Tax=Pseudosporangium ferrugineum TaxID=439699 RepID=A0A2T0SEL7_9ACTN|nr:hypothetical protein [Pseudosporangium ferrugineum]PRY31854.1 hypothetical protein CLV70_10265 [Pseudosporangium ferrugineum]